jgi:hypothetical protein
MNIRCNYCDSEIEVYTINELLDRAYNTIDNNSLIQKILDILGYTKENVAIAQNRQKTEYDKLVYEVIRSGKEDAIFQLNFDTTMKAIEGFGFRDCYFSNKLDKLYNIDTAKQKFQELFSIFNIDIFKFFEIDLNLDFGKNILIKPKYKKKKQYRVNNLSIDIQDRYFEVVLRKEENSYKNNKYLYQKIINMYPDYGHSDFWIDGCSDSIEIFEKFIKADDPLAVEISDWINWHNTEAPAMYAGDGWKNEVYFNVDEYEKEGKRLHAKLQELVKEDFIIVYYKSFEEYHARLYELSKKISN